MMMMMMMMIYIYIYIYMSRIKEHAVVETRSGLFVNLLISKCPVGLWVSSMETTSNNYFLGLKQNSHVINLML